MNGNMYSSRWFEVFGDAVDPAQTQREIEFLRRVLPLQTHRKILDVCCGSGRHALGLAHAAYEVTGVDADAAAIEKARRSTHTPSARFIVADMRGLQELPRDFDAVICMWQSFAHFDDHTNQSVLREMANRVRSGGRIVLDVYNRDFFECNQGVRAFERNGLPITETKRMDGDRLLVQLTYADGACDQFHWRLYRLAEWRDVAAMCGLALRIECAEFDLRAAPRLRAPRMQLVAEKISSGNESMRGRK